MNLSRNELIKALVKGLKLDDNIFNYQAVAEEIEHINENRFMDFFKTVMSKDNFGNGLKVIIDTVEQFKPITIDNVEIKAKELIDLVKTLNDVIYQEHITSGVSFDDLLKRVSFPSVSKDDIAILNNVKPYCDFKTLIASINHYGTSLECLNAFKSAVKISDENGVVCITNKEKLEIAFKSGRLQ